MVDSAPGVVEGTSSGAKRRQAVSRLFQGSATRRRGTVLTRPSDAGLAVSYSKELKRSWSKRSSALMPRNFRNSTCSRRSPYLKKRR